MIILEIIGGFVFFGFLGLLTLLLIPSLFGCLGFVFFWLILLSLLVFFSVNIGWILLLLASAYAALLLTRYLRYQKLPDYDSYLISQSGAFVEGEVCCTKCGSSQTTHQGLFGRNGRLRYYLCLNCRSWLYRFKVL